MATGLRRLTFATRMAVFAMGLGGLLASSQTAWAQIRCTVNDPTGTPLNVRSRPNGPILGALHNGAQVLLWRLIYVNGRPWARITPIAQGKAGWVFRDYLACEELFD